MALQHCGSLRPNNRRRDRRWFLKRGEQCHVSTIFRYQIRTGGLCETEVIVRTIIAPVALRSTTEASAVPPHLSDGMLVDEHGMTLYAYAGKGTPDATACEGACELNFPSAIADQRDTPTDRLTLVT